MSGGSEEKFAPRPHHSLNPSPDALVYATRIVRRVCLLAGDIKILDAKPDDRLLRKAITAHDTAWLFDWLMTVFSYQGISDAAARSYISAHGNASWAGIMTALASRPACPKLQDFGSFQGCGYIKSKMACGCLDHLTHCPLPDLPLRNGRLNQTAYSLFLFIRDICGGDFIGWLESTLCPFEAVTAAGKLSVARAAILHPMQKIYGVAEKVLNMTMSTLLLSAARDHPHWRRIGSGMVAIDTLVHNFLHRTGILQGFEAEHLYGPACYSADGCSAVIDRLAAEIDVRAFNPKLPRHFARFIQHAIWHYCAQDGLNVCNGNTIEDDLGCRNIECDMYRTCKNIALRNNVIITAH